MRIRRSVFLLISIIASGPLVQDAGAAVLTFTYDNLNLAIPDGSGLGLSNTHVVTTALNQIQSVKIKISVSGGLNGDYFIQLVGGSKNSILMNRVGKTATNDFGYADSGLNVQFSDAGASGDIHTYRTILFGNEATAIGGPLTGVWSPDGRTTDPDSVLNTDPRTSSLANFVGENPNGQWTLFIADLEGGDVGTLVSWELEIDAIPETSSAMICMLGLGAWAFRRPLRNRKNADHPWICAGPKASSTNS